jgi:8-oxo-dGTP pyrophosphatase MutT (NUDIX family)
MHRALLLGRLDRHCPFDEHEAAMTARLRLFVEEHEECFERSLLVGHITGSSWIVDRTRGFALLTHHRKLHKWLQLGGHSDGDPDTLRVAMREAREESGLTSVRAVSEDIFDVDIHAIPARGSEPEHFHYDVRFLLEADSAEPLTVSSESKSLAWVEMARVAELNSERSVMRMVAKTRPTAPNRYPTF